MSFTCQKRRISMKRDIQKKPTQETHKRVPQKFHLCECVRTRVLHRSFTCETCRMSTKRDLQKRPTKETNTATDCRNSMMTYYKHQWWCRSRLYVAFWGLFWRSLLEVSFHIHTSARLFVLFHKYSLLIVGICTKDCRAVLQMKESLIMRCASL